MSKFYLQQGPAKTQAPAKVSSKSGEAGIKVEDQYFDFQ